MNTVRVFFDNVSVLLAYQSHLDKKKFRISANGEEGGRWFLDIEKITPVIWF